MKTSANPPTESGWYWYKAGPGSPGSTGFLRKGVWIVVYVEKHGSTLKVFFREVIHTVKVMKGLWSPRILEPEGEG